VTDPTATTAVAEGHPGIWRRLPGYIGDIGLLLLAILALPVAIIILGTPLALLVRLAASLLQR